jgi:hypothetical protein
MSQISLNMKRPIPTRDRLRFARSLELSPNAQSK